jgi:hypothetical protein
MQAKCTPSFVVLAQLTSIVPLMSDATYRERFANRLRALDTVAGVAIEQARTQVGSKLLGKRRYHKLIWTSEARDVLSRG